MKSSDVIGIIIGILVLLSVVSIPLISALTGGEPVVEREVMSEREEMVESDVTVEKQANIPAIDASRPAKTKTATFALG